METELGPLGEHPPRSPFIEDPEEMRRSGYKVVDAIVDRWTSLDRGPAWQGARYEVTAPALDGPPPSEPQDLDRLLETTLRDILPLAGRIDHPRFLAFVPSSPTWASVLASFLTTGFNIFQGTWLESSGPSQIEVTVTDWLRQWMGYPASGGGLFTSGGSAANLIALVAARESAGNPADGSVYVSEQVHSSVVRAARIAGVSPDRIRSVPVDGSFRIDGDELHRRIRADRSRGLRPFCIIGTAGSTNTGAVDPLDRLADIAAEEDVWLHVDGAYGGFAILDPDTAPLFDGIARSDSVTLDPHKWLFQPYETGCLLTRDVTRLEQAFRVLPEYLQDTAWGPGNVNFCDRGIQLTRTFRALRVWLSVQRYGLDAFRREIARTIALARETESWIRDEEELQLLAPAGLGVVCFRWVGPGDPPADDVLNRVNEEIQSRIVDSGHAMMSSTRLEGRFSLRFCILNARTRPADVRSALDSVLAAGRDMT